MKENIHPTYYSDATITCACGAKYTVGGTKKEMRVEICSNCHPYFTGSHKFIDTAGRVERFKQKLEKSKTKESAKKVKDAD